MDIKLLSTRSRVNSLLQVGTDMYNVYRIDLTSGTLRVATVIQDNIEVVPIAMDTHGMTTDGIMCEIKHVVSHADMLKQVRELLTQEPKLYAGQSFITTDGYYPAIAVGENGGFGIKKDEYDKWTGYSLLLKKNGYKPLITDQCYFSDVWRLLIPCNRILKHIVENFGWLADPYDWQEFVMQNQKKWVEFPPFTP